MKKNGPPLKVWLYFFFAFLVFQSIVYCSVKHENEKLKVDNKTDALIERALKDLEAADETSIKVVIIGSSLVGRGVECHEEMNAAIGSQEVHITKIWGNGDPYHRFVEKGKLLEKLIKIRPNLICIQTELVAVNIKSTTQDFSFFNPILSKISVYNKFAINYIRQKIRPDIYVFSDGMQCLPDDAVIKMDTIHYKPNNRVVKKENEINFAFDDLEKLERAGIKTVIVDLPRPIEVEKRVFNDPFSSQLQQVLSMYKELYGLEHWQYTGKPMYYRHFLDGGHLNKRGSHIYSEWLLDKIKKAQIR